jgi:hypothetical protein
MSIDRAEQNILRSDLVIVAAIFIAVETVYWQAGLRLDATWLDWAWQYLDPIILRRDLFRGLLYLHTQPPAFNLFLGAVLHVAGRHASEAFRIAFAAGRLALDVGVFVLMRRLEVRRVTALAAMTLFAMNPATAAFGHVLFYELPVAVLVVWAAVSASTLASRPSYLRSLVFCSLVAALCLTRSIFHLVYYVAAIVVVTVVAPEARRATLWAALAPLAAVLAVYLKNALLFGFFGASSWLGMSVARMTLPYADESVMRQLAASGRLSPIAMIEPFSPLWMYPSDYRSRPSPIAHPALTAVTKSSGHINFNHAAFVRVSRDYFDDALALVRAQPSAYRTSVGRAWTFYFMSGTENTLAEGNLVPLRRWIEWWDSVVLLRSPRTSICLSLVVGLPLAALWAVWRSRRHLAWAFIALTIGYVAVLGNATEVGENNRFRFATDALSVAALAAAGETITRRLRQGQTPS